MNVSISEYIPFTGVFFLFVKTHRISCTSILSNSSKQELRSTSKINFLYNGLVHDETTEGDNNADALSQSEDVKNIAGVSKTLFVTILFNNFLSLAAFSWPK